MIETASKKMRSIPSQGSHFFHDTTARGIGDRTINAYGGGTISRQRSGFLPEISKTAFMRYARAVPAPAAKIDGGFPCGDV